MDTKKLRKLLQDDNLPTYGDKESLIWRHQEYCLLYNANLDSLQPKTEEQLREQVLITEAAFIQDKKRKKLQKLTEVDVESFRSSYLQRHQSHFEQLRQNIISNKTSESKISSIHK
jgi:E3 ubiquitin-protein ligase RAD18